MDEPTRQPPAGAAHIRHATGGSKRAPHDISLTDTERAEIRRNLISRMEQGTAGTRGSHGFWRSVALRTVLLSCAFLLLGTGTAVAAQKTVPGDLLYSLKVNVFEQVRGRMMPTPVQRAEWEAVRAMRRLREAEHLAANDGLTTDIWLMLHARFVEHVGEAERRIDVLMRNGNPSAAGRLKQDLDMHLQAHRATLLTVAPDHGDALRE